MIDTLTPPAAKYTCLMAATCKPEQSHLAADSKLHSDGVSVMMSFQLSSSFSDILLLDINGPRAATSLVVEAKICWKIRALTKVKDATRALFRLSELGGISSLSLGPGFPGVFGCELG